MALQIVFMEEKNTWEDFLLRYAPQSLFQSWLWGEVQKKSGESIIRIGFYEKKELVGIAQISVVRAKRGTFLYVRHGPIWNTQTYWRQFVKFIVPMAKKEGAWFVRVSPLIAASQENLLLLQSHGFISAPIHEVDAERCWVLDIDKEEEDILMRMRKTTRYEIRIAQKSDVVVRKSANPENLKHFFALYKETSMRHGFVKHGSIQEEFEVFAGDHKALLLLGYYANNLIAGSIVIFYGNQAIYHHGASITSKVPVSYLVQWEAIREAKKRGIKLYNFYGIAPDDKPNHPWRGITLFKKGFGGREISYLHSQDLPVSPLYVIPKTVETVRRIMKGY